MSWTRLSLIIAVLWAFDAVVARSGIAAGADEPITFNKHIAPIVFNNCTTCHRPGEAAPFALQGYEDVRKRAGQIAQVTASRFMPPWLPDAGFGEFLDSRRMSDEQIRLIQQWIDGGMIEGEPDDLPPVPRFPHGWHLGEPDLVLTLEQPYTLAADGPDVFRNFVIPVPLAARKYVRAVEFRPGNPRVVHHAIVYVDQGRSSRNRDAQDDEPGFDGMDVGEAENPDGHFIGWTPGRVPHPGLEGIAWRLDRGSDLVVQLHMQPSGKTELVQPSIGLYFADSPPTRQLFHLSLRNDLIDIQPGEKNYVVEDSYSLPVDVEALTIYPHAHYLGKTMRAWAEHPDGTRTELLRIDEWDFNWQDQYRYAEPVSLPKGTRVAMRYTFDNSSDNVRNPNHPPKRVRFGLQSTDEMATLGIQVLPRSAEDVKILRVDKRQSDSKKRLRVYEYMAQARPDDPAIQNALGETHRALLNHEMARASFEAAVRLKPDSAAYQHNLGVALAELGQLKEAVGRYSDALHLDPKRADTHYSMGLALQTLGKLNEAIRAYRESLRLNPDEASAHFNLGLALQKQGEHATAANHFHEALQIKPEHARAQYSLGLSFALMNQTDEALKHFKAAVDLDPDYAEAHNNLGVALQMKGNLREAEQHFAQAVRLNPQFADAQRNLARIRELLGPQP